MDDPADACVCAANVNNLRRSLLFFIERSNKNSPDWLKRAVGSFIASNHDDLHVGWQ
jgi:hypothetical protein